LQYLFVRRSTFALNNCFVNHTEVGEMKTAAMEAGEQRRKELERKLEEWRAIPLNVAVIGHSAGDIDKLSFINTLRGLSVDDVEPEAVVDNTPQETHKIPRLLPLIHPFL